MASTQAFGMTDVCPLSRGNETGEVFEGTSPVPVTGILIIGSAGSYDGPS
ncbi:MAG: hypothetical protein AAF127_10435 [Pseudomonadota bacterium]